MWSQVALLMGRPAFMLTLCLLALRLCCLLQASSLVHSFVLGFQLSNVETTQSAPAPHAGLPSQAWNSGVCSVCMVGESCSAHLGLRVLTCRVG